MTLPLSLTFQAVITTRLLALGSVDLVGYLS